MKTSLLLVTALGSCALFAAHTDAPPGRYDYTAKVAAAGESGAASTARSTGPEEALALADRTYAYVVKALGVDALKDEKAELEADRKWLAAAKTDSLRATVEKEIRRLRRRILFRHPDLQFAKLIAVQRGIPYSRENHMVDQYLGRWSRPGPGLVVIENWRTAPKRKSLLGDKLPAGTVLNPDLHWNADRLLFSFCDHTAQPPADAEKLKVPTVVVRNDPWVKKVDPTHPIYGPGFEKGGERAPQHHERLALPARPHGRRGRSEARHARDARGAVPRERGLEHAGRVLLAVSGERHALLLLLLGRDAGLSRLSSAASPRGVHGRLAESGRARSSTHRRARCRGARAATRTSSRAAR